MNSRFIFKFRTILITTLLLNIYSLDSLDQIKFKIKNLTGNDIKICWEKSTLLLPNNKDISLLLGYHYKVHIGDKIGEIYINDKVICENGTLEIVSDTDYKFIPPKNFSS